MRLPFQEVKKLLTTHSVNTNSPHMYYQNAWTIFFTVWVTIAIIIKVSKKTLVLKGMPVLMHIRKANGTWVGERGP